MKDILLTRLNATTSDMFDAIGIFALAPLLHTGTIALVRLTVPDEHLRFVNMQRRSCDVCHDSDACDEACVFACDAYFRGAAFPLDVDGNGKWSAAYVAEHLPAWDAVKGRVGGAWGQRDHDAFAAALAWFAHQDGFVVCAWSRVLSTT